MSPIRRGVTAVLAAGAVNPVLPVRWPVPPARRQAIDYALPAQADAWLRHPILGDPSFDSFVREPGNPIVRGSEPFKWPVNVSLLEDPISGNRYAYVGYYLEGYAFGAGMPVTHCRVHKSTDQGKTWTEVGPVFDDPGFKFEGDEYAATIAPDVQVVYHDGRYHMSYDWCTSNTTWANASAPSGGADSGLGYAWADRPEGPFHRAPRPILRTSEVQKWNNHSSRYHRAYATSLIRRKGDWLVLADLDSGAHFAWGQVAVTAADPMGRWSEPVMVAGLEGDSYYPAPVEAFPSFVHGGYVYVPRTSVGANRNFQIIMRAPIELAHKPEAWSIYQHGSFWHAEPVAHEAYGLWGQAPSAQVVDGRLDLLFPSRHTEGGVGTINAATRPWSKPMRARGFAISAHSGRSLTVTRTAYGPFELDADVKLAYGTARLAWGYQAPLATVGRADGKPAPATWTRHAGLELTRTGWRVLTVADAPEPTVSGQGALADAARRKVRITFAAGRATVALDGKRVWSGFVDAAPGPMALLLEPGTHLTVDRFAVAGAPRPATQLWLASEAIAGSGIAEGSYDAAKGPMWHVGQGAVCRTPGERAKWNFRGRGFRLWAPRGPEYGTVTVLLDGKRIASVDLRADAEAASEAVLSRAGLDDGFHALVLRADDRPLPLDCLEALQ